MAPTLARTRVPDRRMPSRTSGAAARRSMAVKAANVAAAPTRPPSVRAEAQPASGASTTVKTSKSMAPVMASAPATYLAEGGSTFLAVRRYKAASSVRLLGAGIFVAIVCVLASRLIDFRPGFVFGFIASSVILSPIVLSKKAAAELVVIPALLTLIVAMLAWVALTPLRAATAVDPSPMPVLLETIAAILFIGGLEAVAFSLIPLSFMDGVTVFRWNKIVWVVLFGTAVFLFWQLVLNREGKYLEAFQQSSVLVCVALADRLRRAERCSSGPTSASGSGGRTARRPRPRRRSGPASRDSARSRALCGTDSRPGAGTRPLSGPSMPIGDG